LYGCSNTSCLQLYCKTLSLLQDNLHRGILDIQETNSSVPVEIVPTVPISCPPCSVTVHIANPRGLTVSTCSLTFSTRDPPMTDRTISVRAVPTAGNNSRLSRLEFHRLDTFVSGSGWDHYHLKPIPVSIRLSKTSSTLLFENRTLRSTTANSAIYT